MVPCLTTIKRGAKYAGTRYLYSQCDIDYEDRIAPWPSFAGDKCLFFICYVYLPFTRKRIVSLYFGLDVRSCHF